jgi:hypothetical protein
MRDASGRKIKLHEIDDPYLKYRVAEQKQFLMCPLSKRKKGRLI